MEIHCSLKYMVVVTSVPRQPSGGPSVGSLPSSPHLCSGLQASLWEPSVTHPRTSILWSLQPENPVSMTFHRDATLRTGGRVSPDLSPTRVPLLSLHCPSSCPFLSVPHVYNTLRDWWTHVSAATWRSHREADRPLLGGLSSDISTGVHSAELLPKCCPLGWGWERGETAQERSTRIHTGFSSRAPPWSLAVALSPHCHCKLTSSIRSQASLSRLLSPSP